MCADLAEVEVEDAELKRQFLEYLKHYALCLAQTDIAQLEADWRRLDELWMKIRCAWPPATPWQC